MGSSIKKFQVIKRTIDGINLWLKFSQCSSLRESFGKEIGSVTLVL